MPKEESPVYKRLSDKNFIETPHSDITRNINYSVKDKILEIEYRPNFIYQYLKVPGDVWKDYKKTLDDKGSSAKFIHSNKIKDIYNGFTKSIS